VLFTNRVFTGSISDLTGFPKQINCLSSIAVILGGECGTERNNTVL